MQQFNKSFLRTLIVGATLVGSLAASGSVLAASQCKGLDNSACDASASCSWVDAYERKDGRKVNAFCRTKAKRAATKTKQTQTKQQG